MTGQHGPRTASPAAGRATGVLVLTDNPLTGLGLHRLLAGRAGITWHGAGRCMQEARRAVRHSRPDVVVLDMRLPLADWLSLVGELSRRARVLVVSHVPDPAAIAATLDAGATSYVVHGELTAAELVGAILDTGAGTARLSRSAAAVPAGRAPWPRLSPREADVMAQVARGLTNADIAKRLFLSEKTVKNHLYNVFTKLRVSNRAEAIVLWLGLADRVPA